MILYIQRRQSKKEFSTISSSIEINNCLGYERLNNTRNCLVANTNISEPNTLVNISKYVVSEPFVCSFLARSYMGNCFIWNPDGYDQVGST
ncbi:hypothetical protein NC651_024234 [Populus alba x Populus x berolinensis]|nr:hypothetical protein NC651_024234 [Populus alba x Populus x berolinensis]